MWFFGKRISAIESELGEIQQGIEDLNGQITDILLRLNDLDKRDSGIHGELHELHDVVRHAASNSIRYGEELSEMIERFGLKPVDLEVGEKDDIGIVEIPSGVATIDRRNECIGETSYVEVRLPCGYEAKFWLTGLSSDEYIRRTQEMKERGE